MKYLILSLMLTFSTIAQTKFIKEYHYKFIVDKGISAQTVDSLVSIANSALENVDKNGYGLRIVNDGIQDTVSLGANYYMIKDSISKLREKDYLAYITKESIFMDNKIKPLGARTDDLKALYVVLGDVIKSGRILAHEFLHNTGAAHSPASLNMYTNFWADDLMSTNSVEINSYVYPETREMIWKRLLNTRFYDFKVVNKP